MRLTKAQAYVAVSALAVALMNDVNTLRARKDHLESNVVANLGIDDIQGNLDKRALELQELAANMGEDQDEVADAAALALNPDAVVLGEPAPQANGEPPLVTFPNDPPSQDADDKVAPAKKK